MRQPGDRCHPDPAGSRGAWGATSRASPARLRVEGVAQAVAEQVERQHGDEDGQTRHDHVRGVDLERLDRLGQHLAPGRRRRLHADPEEGERGLVQDVGGDGQRGVDEHRRSQVGQQLAEQDPGVAGAQTARGLDELLLAERDDLAADDTTDVGPAEEADDDDEQAESQRGTTQGKKTTLMLSMPWKIASRAIEKRRTGKASRMSMARLMTVSIQPPR